MQVLCVCWAISSILWHILTYVTCFGVMLSLGSFFLFVAVKTLHVSDFTQTCTRTKENRHWSFQKYKSAPSFQSEKIGYEFRLFSDGSYNPTWKWIRLRWNREKVNQSQDNLFSTALINNNKLHFLTDCSHFKAKKVAIPNSSKK